MTLRELKERVDYFMDIQNGIWGDTEVSIPNNKKGMYGRTPTTGVRNASVGIDWDSKTFFIWPETEMIEMNKDTYVGDDILNEEANKHAELHAKLFPMKHTELSDDECKRINDVAKGSYYIGYKDGYKKENK